MGQSQSHHDAHRSLNGESLSDSSKLLLVQALENTEDILLALQSEQLEDTASCVLEEDGAEVQRLKDRLLLIRDHPDNMLCADCNQPSSTWVSLTFGVFLCADCVGSHRSLGATVSFTQSITLDSSNFTEEAIDSLSSAGNKASNMKLEFHVPDDFSKPDNNCPGEHRRNYIKAKYEAMQFTEENNPGMPEQRPTFWTISNVGQIRGGLQRVQSTAIGKELYIGIMQVKVVCAQELKPALPAISLNDSTSFFTNPYCVVKMGRSLAKTKFISRTLNPTWNEGFPENMEFSFAWDGLSNLRAAVWNHDKLGKNKLMASAVLDLSALKDSGSVEKRQVWLDLLEYRPEKSAARTLEKSSSSDTAMTVDTHDDSCAPARQHSRRKSYTSFHIRDKVKDALGIARTDSGSVLSDMGSGLVRARIEKGYFPGGRLLLELSFNDLR